MKMAQGGFVLPKELIEEVLDNWEKSDGDILVRKQAELIVEEKEKDVVISDEQVGLFTSFLKYITGGTVKAVQDEIDRRDAEREAEEKAAADKAAEERAARTQGVGRACKEDRGSPAGSLNRSAGAEHCHTRRLTR